MSDVTRILFAIEHGDARAVDKLLPVVYDELRLLAAQKLSQERPGQTLQATALVHEAYIRLAGSEGQNWSSRGHFFAAAAEAMRRILIDNARRKQRLKHGGDHQRVEFDDTDIAIEEPSTDLIALDGPRSR
jgi:RNA polymerase sigma factor (TIGR02999 family)